MPPGVTGKRLVAELADLEPGISSLLAAAQDQMGAELAGGSNNWAISAERTSTGRPIVAGDPHRVLEMPNVAANKPTADWGTLHGMIVTANNRVVAPEREPDGRASKKSEERTMALDHHGAFIRNIAEVPWREFPNHFGGALSKPLVMPETAGSRHIDYRISMYQPMAHVARHKHQAQEQIYHVLEGEGLMEISGLVDLVFLVITSPVTDDEKPL